MGDNNEVTRLVRTGVQAVVVGFVGVLGAVIFDLTGGMEINENAIVLWVAPIVFGFVMPIVTGAVEKAKALPGLGKYLVFLNGPRRDVEYTQAA